jgi:excisionase family DNA binding protein
MQSAHSWRNTASNQHRPADLLTTEQVAEILSVSPRSVIRWRNERFGPPFCRLGRQVRYRRGSVEKWIADNEHLPVRGAA